LNTIRRTNYSRREAHEQAPSTLESTVVEHRKVTSSSPNKQWVVTLSGELLQELIVLGVVTLERVRLRLSSVSS